MSRLLAKIAFALSALWLPGCVDGSPDTPAIADTGRVVMGGSGGSGGNASAGQPAAGTAGTSAGQSAGGASAGGAMACSSYMDATGYKLPVHIKNVSSKTLYLGQQTMTCEPERLFQVEDGARTVLPRVDDCHNSCQAMMQGTPVTCPLACGVPSTVTLAPGQTFDVPWDGRFGAPQTLPLECVPGASTSSTACVQAKQIEPALFTFTAQAGTARQCLDPSGTCACTPGTNGTCSTPSSLIAGTIITTEFLVKLEPAELSPSGEPPYIGLEFKDSAK